MGLFLCLVCNLGAIRGRFRQVFWFGVVRGVVTTYKRKEAPLALACKEFTKTSMTFFGSSLQKMLIYTEIGT